MTFLKQSIKKIFQYEARLVLKKYKPKIIAITGSVGKTTTKEALYTVLAKKFFVRKSEKSFTAELGVPLTIIGCPEGSGTFLRWVSNLLFGLKLLFWKNHYPDWLILEMDGDKPGDLKSISKWLRPNILVITAIGNAPSHIELFYDLGDFLNEKKYLVDSVARDGVIFYNADDEQSSNLATYSSVRKISCGIGNGCDVKGTEFKILYGNASTKQVPTGMMFEISKGKENQNVTVFQSVGIHNEYACLLALSVGSELGISFSEIISSLNQLKTLSGRMNIISGIKDSLIIDDSYNSSPVALGQALDVFSKIESKGKKVIVVGDMLELGKYSAEEHRKSAHKMKEIADYVICVGVRSRLIADELLSFGFPESKIIQTDSSGEAGVELQKIIEVGDIALVKGSQAMRMERVVEEVMRHPEDKEKLLVRQGEEWLSRE